jgi:signal transduction histidine kinase/ligand-binding sensor domain-containing protein
MCAWAEQLSLKSWTTADGLAHNHINRIRQDSRGYLWICTDEGLSRFDGYQFTNYTTAHGLPHRSVSNLIEARDGTYWLATDGGVCRFDPDGVPAPYRPGAQANRRAMFVVYRLGEHTETNYVNNLVEDRDGALWCATSAGLFRLRRAGEQVTTEWVELGLPRDEPEGQHVSTVAIDPQGRLWAGAISGLYVRWPDGRVERFTTREGLPGNYVQSLLVDRDGSLWSGIRRGGFCHLAEPRAGRPITERCYSTRDGLAGDDARQLFRASDGRLWIATIGGLSELGGSRPAGWPPNRPILSYTTANGLSGDAIYVVAEDRAGNLWLGTSDNGVMRLARVGFATWTAADGFQKGYQSRAFGGKDGEVCIQNFDETLHRFQQFDGQRFNSVPAFLPNQVTLLGYPHLLPPGHRLQTLLTQGTILHRLYVDARGDLWFTLNRQNLFQNYRLESATGKLIALEQVSAAFKETQPNIYRESATGQLWIGLSSQGDFSNGLIRYQQGRFTHFTEADGAPKGTIKDLLFDRAGRLWIASSEGGLARIDQPTADAPRFTRLSTADGLWSDEILCLTEDERGYIYAGNNRGVDRLDPASGRVKHYTAADGLAEGAVLAAWRDPRGALWFVTVQAVSRLIPAPDDTSPRALPVFISGVRVAGVQRRSSALGEVAPAPLELSAGENNVSIDFIGLELDGGERLRYQYQLTGVDPDWSQPTEQRTVNYARLAPGSYRFAVRAVNAQGAQSDPPATLTFTIPPPLWQRWWFMLLAALAVGLVIYALYRYRLAQLLEVERVRTRIATDLHDDIGVNLSLIAMVSELAHQQTPPDQQQMHGWLSLIADTSRGMVDSMSDLVWTINPEKDRLNDLTQRMWRLADELFKARDIKFDFTASDKDRDIRLGIEMRREVFLIFKESVNNAVRHAECTEVAGEFECEHDWLRLTLRDNGCGFDPQNGSNSSGGGNGLASMRRRALKLGGELQVISAPGGGTTIILRAPVQRHRWARWKAELLNRLKRKARENSRGKSAR